MINIQLSELDLSLEVADIDDLAVILDDQSSIGLQGPILFGPNASALDFGQLDLDLLGFPYQGNSAYQIAVSEGFTGTAAEWLASLVGPESPNAAQAEAASAAAALSATSAQNHANAAELSKNQASASATAAAASAATAANSSAQSLVHRTAAENVAVAVALLEQQTEAHVTDAEQFAAASQVSRVAAETARSAAEASETSAATSATSATASAASATNSATLAVNAQTAAGNSAAAALLSESAASSYADDSLSSANASQISQIAATASREEAEIAASAAVIHRNSAEAYADDASSSASAAAISATEASTGAGDAGASATAAAASAAAALGSANTAVNEAIAAATSAIGALASSNSAATYANNSSDSATTAEGHSSDANLSASAAATSASDADSSSTAASGHANTASTQATNAGNSATAASASAVSAASSYNSAIRLNRNPLFDQGLAGWTHFNVWSPVASSEGRANVLRSNAGASSQIFSGDLYPIQPGANYRLSISHRVHTGNNVVHYAGLFFYDAAGNQLSATDGTGNYPLGGAYSVSASSSWTDRTVLVGPGLSSSAPYWGTPTFPANTAFVRPVLYFNYTSVAGAICEIDSFSMELATSEVGALASATAAAFSASSALTSATDAGESASSATTQATNAATSAGEASTSETNASESATTAQGHAATASAQASLAAESATAAGGSATAANTSAGQANTSATNAGNSATAANNSAVSAASSYTNTVVSGGNQDFSDGLTGWSWNTDRTIPASNYSTGWLSYQTSFQGRPNVIQQTTGNYCYVYSNKLWPVQEGRTYRVRSSVWIGAVAPTQTYIGMRALDSGGAAVTGNGGHIYNVAGGVQLATNQWHDLVSASFTVASIDAGLRNIQLLAFLNYGVTAGASSALDGIWLEDITESVAANNSATAAAGSQSLANTSATNAGNSAIAANASAVAAASSFTDANNAATNATNAATAAGGSQTAAQTHATNAGNSATAASASAVSAASSFTNTVLIEGNTDFSNGFMGWYNAGGTTPTATASLGGRTNVLSLAAGVAGQYRSTKRFPVDTTRKYKVSTEVYAGAGSGSTQFYVGFAAFDANGNALSHSPGSYAYSAIVGETFAANSGWHRRDSLLHNQQGPITGEGTGTWIIFPVGTRSIELLVLQNYNNAACVSAVNYVYLEDITETQAALSSANAATLSASNAFTSAGEAGASAGSSLTQATNASVSANDAELSAITASTQASNASASASSASSSATIAASVSVASISKNPRFTDYPTTSGLPTAWDDWSNGASGTRVDNPSGGYAYRMTRPAATLGGIVQYSPVASVKLNDYLVFEYEVTLVSGSLLGAGVHVNIYNDALSSGLQQVNVYFPNEIPVGMTVAPGAGVVGETYRYSKLVQVTTANATRPLVYAMNAWDGFISLAAIPTKTLDWRRCGYRAATAAEIAAGVALPALSASVSTTQSVVAGLSAQDALARYEVVADTGGGTARLRLVSSTYGTRVLLDADYIKFGDNTTFDNAVDVLVTTTGSVSRIIAWGANFGISGNLIEWQGPSSVTWGNHSELNCTYARTSAGKIYVEGKKQDSLYTDVSAVVSTNISSLSFVDVVTLTLDKAVTLIDLFRVSAGLDIQLSPRTRSSSTTTAPSGLWEIWELPASGTVGERKVASGSWSSNIIGSGPNSDYITDMNMGVAEDNWSDISREWRFKHSGLERFVLRMKKTSSESLIDATIKIRATIQKYG